MKNEELLNELTELERERARGWLTRDRAVLESLTDDDFVEINYFGRLTKKQILDELFPHLILKKFDMDGFRLLAHGDNIAVLSYKVDEIISFKDSDTSGTFHVTSVYRRKGEKWLLLIWQITPLIEANK